MKKSILSKRNDVQTIEQRIDRARMRSELAQLGCGCPAAMRLN